VSLFDTPPSPTASPNERNRLVIVEEFRRQAVDLIPGEKLSIPVAARRFGVYAKTPREWVEKYRPATTPPCVEQERRRLREGNRQLRMARDVVGKAAIDSAQPPS